MIGTGRASGLVGGAGTLVATGRDATRTASEPLASTAR